MAEWSMLNGEASMTGIATTYPPVGTPGWDNSLLVPVAIALTCMAILILCGIGVDHYTRGRYHVRRRGESGGRLPLRSPSRHRKIGCRRWAPPGLELAPLVVPADDSDVAASTGWYGQFVIPATWLWSLRDDGTVWLRLLTTRKPTGRQRKEPQVWTLAGKLSFDQRRRYDDPREQASPRLLLDEVVAARLDQQVRWPRPPKARHAA